MRALTTAFSGLCLRRAYRTYATLPASSSGSSPPAPANTDADASDTTESSPAPSNARVLITPADSSQPAFAQAASAPLKVQERRAKIVLDYARSRPADRAMTREEKHQAVRPAVSTSLRSRLRGVRLVRRGTKLEEEIVGQRVYLPNIVFTMMPNHTRAGEAYNPYEATFRIAHNITKTDVRSYLTAVYGVACTYIRTDNKFTPQKYLKNIASGRQVKANHRHGYKRAIVGLKEPFYFPQMVEDMDGRARWLREAQLEDDFRLKEVKEMIQNKQTKWSPKKKPAKIQFSRGKLIKTLWERRLERERAKRDFAEALGTSKPEDLTVPESSS